ncbi:MAG: outer membrane murein-binding lipoprotein Lpp [Yoonia sp.]|jgi:outer membrane murein-binding lipoprotein Lpp
MRTAFLMLPLIALAACATPREQCINDVTRDTRVLNALINQTRGNISRGYALEQRQDVRTVRGTCRGRNEDGTTFLFSCEETNTINTTVPAAIDLNAEQAKLASLQERLAQSQLAANQAVAQCIAIHSS